MDQERTREPRRVAIIGLGLIGGSLGLALRAVWPDIHIVGYDTKEQALNTALSKGIIDEASHSLPASCRECDFVFVAAPVSIIPKILREVGPFVEKNTIVSDVGSTKARIVDAARGAMSEGVNFIGGHPMAGSEQEGIRSATASLFKEAIYVLTPTSRTSPEAFQRLHSLITKMGARVMALTPEKHDQVVAAVSHLPHVLASALVNLVSAVDEDVENRLLFAAGSFRDMTRIASSNPRLWADICLDNRESVITSIDQFTKVLNQIKNAIESRDHEELLEILGSAREHRIAMVIGETSTNGDFLVIDILVGDHPGAISQITLAFGQLGINIEDIQIIPLSDDRGIIRLTLGANENMEKAISILKGHGFDIFIGK